VVVAGAGFAGVETIAAINDFLHGALRHYPNLRREHLRVVLVTPDDVILPELSPKLGRYAQAKLAARGVAIVTRARVARAENGVVTLSDGRTLAATTLVWTAGTAPNPIVTALPLPKTRGRLTVDECLAVPDAPGVWAVGDCALVPDGRGGFHPPTAQHALRQGTRVAANVLADVAGRPRRPFRFRTLGRLAAIGRRTGVANVLGVNFSGFVAWWLWRTIYLAKLPRFEKKVRVALDWTLDLFFAKDITATRRRKRNPAHSSLHRPASAPTPPDCATRVRAPRRAQLRTPRELSPSAPEYGIVPRHRAT
jgi:NADH dehydrogenase